MNQQPPEFLKNSDEPTRINSLEKSMELLMSTFMTSQHNMERQISQLANTLYEREKGKMPSQPDPNLGTSVPLPRHTQLNSIHQSPHYSEPSSQCNAIYALRSGREYQQEVPIQPTPVTSEPPVNVVNVPHPLPIVSAPHDPPIVVNDQPPVQGMSDEPIVVNEEKHEEPSKKTYVPKAPFPNRFKSNKKDAITEKILNILKNVQVNIPFLDAISQVSTYAKVLKDLCIQKQKINVPKKAFLTANVSSVLSQQIVAKYKDPGCPTISCMIGNTRIDHALLDLGASVNLLPYSVYQQLGLGDLKPTSVTLQLADRSVKTPKGVIKVVLLKVGEFLFPMDFIILDTQPKTNIKG
ncbi:uncharacterized protein LOC122650116 [Telopea speciosissima]|uniref:uncharacterized protein LOC122650116 n=1 Tax=Telopea speciosissima TaxID=54955 RepID=UPI001CC35EA7|nr:uncharacterized protein LOC122650116 [Telopea speciosissima]